MHHLLSPLRVALRALIWRETPTPAAADLAVLAAWFGLYLACTIALEYASAQPPVKFDPYGLNSALALALLGFAASVFFMPAGSRVASLAAFAALWTAALPLFEFLLLLLLAFEDTLLGGDASVIVALVLLLSLCLIWHVGAAAAILRSMEPQLPRRSSRRCATTLTMAMVVIAVALPLDPVFKGSDFDRSSANVWELARSVLGAGAADRDR